MKQHGKKSYTVEEAMEKLMHYCAYRDRSQKEVEDKLDEMRMIPEAKEKIIVRLMRENFLNEERYARSFCRGKFRIKKWGRNKIKQELYKKGISGPIIKLGLSEINEKDYLNTFFEVAEKKSDSINESNQYKKKNKLANYLLNRGFESNIIFDNIDDLLADEKT